MENLSYYLISNIGKEISYNTLKSISHLDDKTAKQYISYLQDANLLYLVSNYDFSLKKLIGNKKKVYLVDPIFTCLSFKISPDHGRLFENFVYMFLRRNENELYFFKNGFECDFIIKQGLKIRIAIQVCYELSDDNKEREFTRLKTDMDKFNLKEGYIITLNQHYEENGVCVIDVINFINKFGINSEN